MKPGEHTPPAARTLVASLATMIPRPTNMVIQKQVKMTLGVKLSFRTIGRICEAAGLPTSSRSNPAKSEPLFSQMEHSGHWPNLRLTAKDLSGHLVVSLSQILGFPWLSKRNDRLLMTNDSGKIKVGHSMEEENLFLGLREHLPKNKLFTLLTEWKTIVGKIATDLDSLCVLAKRRGRRHQWVGEEELDSEVTGLTQFFVKSLVLEATEEICGLSQNRDKWETSAPNNLTKSWILRRVRDGSSFVLVALGPEESYLNRVKQMHQKQFVRIKSSEQIRDVGTQWLELREVTRALTKELNRVSNLALFPGKCNLCSGQ